MKNNYIQNPSYLSFHSFENSPLRFLQSQQQAHSKDVFITVQLISNAAAIALKFVEAEESEESEDKSGDRTHFQYVCE
jgi:hypothetical protein